MNHRSGPCRKLYSRFYPCRHRSKGRGIETEHPAVFPVVLPEFLMRAYTDEGELVFEPFGGSGTTILVAQRTGRRVRAIELAPAYIDLAIARWRMLHPDLPVTLADNGRDYDAVTAARMVEPGRHAVLLLDQAGWHLSADLEVPHRPSATSEVPGAERDGKRLAVYARQLAVQPGVCRRRRHRRALLLLLEPADRDALAHHVDRPARLGAPVLTSGIWY